jgi:hypothetical protein
MLYLISGASSVKVGIAADVDKRIVGLRKASPVPLVLEQAWAFERRQAAWLAEQATHRLLSEHRTWGEWFAVTPLVARTAIETVLSAQASTTESAALVVREA